MNVTLAGFASAVPWWLWLWPCSDPPDLAGLVLVQVTCGPDWSPKLVKVSA